MDQITLFDYAESLIEKPKPAFNVGDRIYKIVLDVIETGIVDHIWDCSRGAGYAAKRDDKNGYVTFWEPDIGITAFSDKEQAERVAESRRNDFMVIRVQDMDPIEVVGYKQTYRDGTEVEHYLVIMSDNSIYQKRHMLYPFFHSCNNVTEMRSQIGLMKREIENDPNGKVERANVIYKLEDMYFTEQCKWSSYKYAEHNGAVLRE